MPSTVIFCLDDLLSFYSRCIDGDMTIDCVYEEARFVNENHESLKEQAKKLKVKELKQLVGIHPRGRKPELIDQLINRLAGQYVFGNVSYMFGQDYMQVCLDLTLKQTTADFLAFVERLREQKRKNEESQRALLKALEKPETYIEFKTFIDYMGYDKLSVDQRVRFDELYSHEASIKRMELFEKQAKRPAIELGDDLIFDLAETVHSKKHHELFVVSLSMWVRRQLWLDLFKRCREFGGYYSSYNEHGAIPGFQFRSSSDRESFCNSVIEGGDSLEDRLTEARRTANLKCSERLTELAFRMAKNAEQTINADRKTNTAKRAAEATRIEERARHALQQSDTILNIANVIGDDIDHVLAGIRYRTDVDQLESLLRSATSKAMRESADAGEIVDWHREPVIEDIAYAAIPQFVIHIDEAEQLLSECAEVNASLAYKMLRKRVREATRENILLPEKLATQLVEKLDGKPWYINDALITRLRLERMGINSDYELRYALRCYFEMRGVKHAIDPIKQKERELVGRKIPGFFPTPPPVIEAMLERVGVDEGTRVLDPSCGKGDILAAAVDKGAEVIGYEVNSDLVDICNAKDLSVIHGDFFQQPVEQYDVVLMNPPFENKQALTHIKHAFDYVAEGGSLVAIAPSSVLYNQDNDHSEFRGWLNEQNAHIQLNPAHAFRSSFNPTDVQTVIIDIHK